MTRSGNPPYLLHPSHPYRQHLWLHRSLAVHREQQAMPLHTLQCTEPNADQRSMDKACASPSLRRDARVKHLPSAHRRAGSSRSAPALATVQLADAGGQRAQTPELGRLPRARRCRSRLRHAAPVHPSRNCRSRPVRCERTHRRSQRALSPAPDIPPLSASCNAETDWCLVAAAFAAAS